MKTKLFLLCLVSAVCLSQAHAGDKERRGTAGSDQLLIPVTARTAALGAGFTSGLASASGLEGLFANPAALTVNAGTNALFSRTQYVADIGVNYFGIAQRFGANQLALTINTWDFGDIPLQTELAPEVSEVTWTANYTTVGATYAREFTDRISAGVTFKLVSERIDDVSSNGMAFDAGMTYVVGESGLRFGVSLKNFGPSREFGGTGLKRQAETFDEAGNPLGYNTTVTIDGAEYELPSLLNFGVAYTRALGSAAEVTLMSNFRSNSFASDQYSAGLEVGLREILYLRGGYEFQNDMDLTFYSGANLGAGLNLSMGGTALTVDYAYRATEFFDAVQMVTASITL
jgi:hypothetical protein